MASAYLYKDMTGNAPSTKMTYSGWIKKVNPADNGRIFGAQSIACHAYFGGSDGTLNVDFAARDSSSSLGIRKPTRLFKDTSAWYHIVFALDTTQGTADDRIKVWINGVQETSFTTKTNPSQNSTTAYGDDGYYSVGARMSQQGGAGHYFDGVMSHVHYCDGYAYAASDFGETDATTGIWKPKVSPSVTYGTNGFFLKFDNSANMGLDSAGSNNLTTSGTIIQNKDTPSNVYATLNSLASINDTPTFSNTNNTIVVQNASAFGAQSSLGMSKGKYYAEFKMTASSDNDMAVGVNSDTNAPRTDLGPGFGTHSTAYRETGTLAVNGSDDISYGNSYAVNDIVGIAIDLDNNKLYFSKNGVFQNSGVPTSGSTGTGARSITAADSTESGFYFFNAGSHSNSQGGTWQANFGNGYFGTSAVASAQSPDDGNGIFEYDVPAGYRALCTKSLNAQEYS